MEDKNLTLKQNICSFRIFLNAFGLILDNNNDIHESSNIKIFDQDKKEVGYLYFDNSQANIVVNRNNNKLVANHTMLKAFCNIVCPNEIKVATKWISQINFEMESNSQNNLSGQFIIGNLIDTDNKIIYCECKPRIKYHIADKIDIILNFYSNVPLSNLRLDLQILKKESQELIIIKPYSNSYSGDLIFHHILVKSKYDLNQEEDKDIRTINFFYEYPYKKFTTICHNQKEDQDGLRVCVQEKEKNNTLSYKNEYIPKNNSTKPFIQGSMLMQQLDPEMFTSIEQLRQILTIDNVSLLDNFISICYDGYTDEEVKALLGIQRKRMNYQGDYDNLIQAYYEMDKNKFFALSDTQKEYFQKVIKK